MNRRDWLNTLNNVGRHNITLIPSSQHIAMEDITQRWFPGRQVIVCDAYVKDIEKEQEIIGGYQFGLVINIDHHAPTATMARPISSTPLAIEYVRDNGVADQNDEVVINHTDCDSLLSAAIVAGIIAPDQIFAEAAIAADHTGERNDVADLLQACGNFRDVDFSLRNLAKLQLGLILEPKAQQALDAQRQDRRRATQLVKSGAFHFMPNGVAWVKTPSRIDGVFFPALLPQAKVILQVTPIAGTDKFGMGLRLGLAAPEDMTIHNLDIQKLDPAFGGRWNAGNNKRAGGSSLQPEEYARRLDSLVAQWSS